MLRKILPVAAVVLLAGCGLIEPSEGQMQGAVVRALTPQFGPGVQVEYLSKTFCVRRLNPWGYFCRFQVSVNVPAGKLNQGRFFYRNGWQATLSYDPHYPD